MPQDLLNHLFGGFVRMHILYHAAKGPIWGLEMMAELDHHGYQVGPGTLYPILHQLEAAGLLSCETTVVAGKRRKNYRITAAGTKLLGEARERLRELVSELLEDKDGMAKEKQRPVAASARKPRGSKRGRGHAKS
jgi:DNA-binding PadR family transcriptional regulator